jgi:hypothetical protein
MIGSMLRSFDQHQSFDPGMTSKGGKPANRYSINLTSADRNPRYRKSVQHLDDSSQRSSNRRVLSPTQLCGPARKIMNPEDLTNSPDAKYDVKRGRKSSFGANVKKTAR